MNMVFVLVMVVGLVLLTVHDPQSVPTYLVQGTQRAVRLAIDLTAVYAMWMGILHLAADCGLDKGVAKVYRPLLRRLLPRESPHAIGLVGLNLTANLLGLGSAATPLGIQAMEGMSRGKERASHNMILFFVLNVTAVQLIPGTVVALRAAHGSANPSSVVLPTLLASGLSCLLGVTLCGVCRGLDGLAARRKNKQNGTHKPPTMGANRRHRGVEWAKNGD